MKDIPVGLEMAVEGKEVQLQVQLPDGTKLRIALPIETVREALAADPTLCSWWKWRGTARELREPVKRQTIKGILFNLRRSVAQGSMVALCRFELIRALESVVEPLDAVRSALEQVKGRPVSEFSLQFVDELDALLSPVSDTEWARRILEAESAVDPKTRFAKMVESGLIDSEGQLTPAYGGPR